jgi:hypothetical protein
MGARFYANFSVYVSEIGHNMCALGSASGCNPGRCSFDAGQCERDLIALSFSIVVSHSSVIFMRLACALCADSKIRRFAAERWKENFIHFSKRFTMSRKYLLAIACAMSVGASMTAFA